ncbi:hypothetical protein LZ575_15870 [Antarcticibacterium sp. 1MA-6-2]|uniref:hypothetical protein n=1 Tax=Antarcticibacterium sp. 1MA-6-2 TaxID=2908210 RepID=UPI001F330A02|nr:hypothetical protein [Antarcticibacterium sp. 1MA-6-2]UJH90319.1 hypothetical protein LZ575_15870 [Antarcticibacterium sp. 1MA-6-2]
MKTSNKLYILLIFVLAFFTSTMSFSQSIIQGDPDPEIEERAAETTEMWARELGLTSKQEILMEKKIIEFTMRRKDLLNSKMNEAAKKERLIVLQEEERADMTDILTQPQIVDLVIQAERIAEAAENNEKKEQ